MSVPAWVYKRMAIHGDISEQEVYELEKFAESISAAGRAGARAVVKDPSNNLDNVLKDVDSKDRDDVLRALRQMKKQASYSSSTKQRLHRMQKTASLGSAAAMMGGAALAPVVAHLAMRGVNAFGQKSPAQLQQDLERILQVHPDIGRPNDPRVQMAYQALVKLNPEYASDPLIAGPLLKQIVESRMDPTNPRSAPYVDPNMAKNLTDAYKSHAETTKNLDYGSFGGDVRSSMMGGTQGASRELFR